MKDSDTGTKTGRHSQTEAVSQPSERESESARGTGKPRGKLYHLQTRTRFWGMGWQ